MDPSIEIFLLRPRNEDNLNIARRRVLELLHSRIPQPWISEIGSTAIAGLIGKEDLDFLVRVPQIEFENVRAILNLLLERNPEQISNEHFQGYRVSGLPDVSVQLTLADGPFDSFHQFLQALSSDPALLAEYNRLKRLFDGKPMVEYRIAKDRFIESVLSDNP